MRSFLMLLVFLAASAATYFYAIADIPYRDQIHYMIERPYFGSSWDWLLHSLSWSKTKFLWPGDSYLFRPVLMGVLALKDILLRGNIFASGAVNIAIMGLTGYSLYLFSRKLLPATYAIAVAVLFVVQHAALEVVAWGHISPYLLSLAFFGFALNEVMKAAGGGRSHLIWAGVFLLIGAMAHEIVILAVSMAAIALAVSFIKAQKGSGGGVIPRGSFLLRTIVLPFAAFAALYIAVYVSHGSPQKFDPLFHGYSGLFSSLLPAPGAAALAFFAPFTMKFSQTVQDMLIWDFSGMLSFVQVVGAVVCIALMTGIYLSLRAARRRGLTPLNASALMTLMMLCSFIVGIGYGRIYLRDVAYFYGATYYYAFSGYIFCLLIAMGLHKLLARTDGTGRLRAARYAALALIVALAAFNYSKTLGVLKYIWDYGYRTSHLELGMNKALSENRGKYCLAGFTPDAGSAGDVIQSLMLRDRFCEAGDPRLHAFVTTVDGSLWLSGMRKSPVGVSDAAGTVETSPLRSSFRLLEAAMIPGIRERGSGGESLAVLSREYYDRPDLSVTVTNSDYTAVVLGYEDQYNYIAFVMEGPLVYCRYIINGRPGPINRENALPVVGPTHRLEVRRSGPNILFFVDGYLLTFMPATYERTGKVGLSVHGAKGSNISFSNFVAEPSSDATTVFFTPEIRIPG